MKRSLLCVMLAIIAMAMPLCGCKKSDTTPQTPPPDTALYVSSQDELKNTVTTAKAESYIKLSNDITITWDAFEFVCRLPNNSTLDLCGHTVTVKVNSGFIVEGEDVTIKNGKVVTDFQNPRSGYALFVGDAGANNRVRVQDIQTKGGLNVFNCEATISNCVIDAREHQYYALWADEHSVINVESGEYYGGDTACVNSTTGEVTADGDGRGIIKINGGNLHGKIIATDLTMINGGTFDSEIVVTYYQSYHGQLIVNKNYNQTLTIVSDSSHDLSQSIDTDGNKVYVTIDKA